jgi:3-deoxy-D-manno-octulosonic-acid transferase
LQLARPGQLCAALRDLLHNAERRLEVASRARAVVSANRGATGRTLDLLAPFLEQDV